MKCKKGIILAGGTGSRLYPVTVATNKQFLPIYDKPTLFYPLTTLMLAGINEILIISNPRDIDPISRFLGTGEDLGLKFSYKVQETPRGLPEAFILGEEFIDNDPVALILGDNFFHGHGLSEAVLAPAQDVKGAHLFLHKVEDPERYGIMILNSNNQLVDLMEKPKNPKSNLAITGLYYFDSTVSARARKLSPSQRGELEITDLIRTYLNEGRVTHTELGRGFVWLDVGTPKSLLEASNYVEMIQTRQGLPIASPHEVAWRKEFISIKDFKILINKMPTSYYKKYLESIIE